MENLFTFISSEQNYDIQLSENNATKNGSCTVGKEKKNTPIYFDINYLTEMTLIPVIIYYCLLQFDTLKFFLGVCLHGGSLPNFNFFSVNPQIFQRNRKVHL